MNVRMIGARMEEKYWSETIALHRSKPKEKLFSSKQNIAIGKSCHIPHLLSIFYCENSPIAHSLSLSPSSVSALFQCEGKRKKFHVFFLKFVYHSIYSWTNHNIIVSALAHPTIHCFHFMVCAMAISAWI